MNIQVSRTLTRTLFACLPILALTVLALATEANAAASLWLPGGPDLQQDGESAADQETVESNVKRGYDIPFIDLDAETERQVAIDAEDGVYMGHPTTVLLEDNRTMFCVYPRGHGRGPIILRRSDDAGLTWSDRLPTPENWATSKETPTIHRTVDAAGQKRLIMFSGLYPIRMAVSEDDGQNWSPLEPIGDYGGIVAMGSVARLADGSYMALFHDDGRFIRNAGKRENPPVFHVYKILSADGGLTWSQPEVIASMPPAQLCEPGLIRSPDGKQIAVLLRENSRQKNSYVIFSDDEGATWTEPRQVAGALTGDRHVGKYAPDGRLFVTFRDMCHESPTKGDWVAWVGTYDDIVAGREGQYRVRLRDNKSGPGETGYPGVEVLPDGTIIATSYCDVSDNNKRDPQVMSVRLRLEELDERAKAQ